MDGLVSKDSKVAILKTCGQENLKTRGHCIVACVITVPDALHKSVV